MKRISLAYGGIAGLVIILLAIVSLHLGVASAWLGYLVMIIAFSSIFFAVRQYRDQALGGVIRFGTAVALGLGITVVASIIYVVVWEIYLYSTHYTFMDTYTQMQIEAQRAAGASDAQLAELTSEMERMKSLYANPLIRVPMTFLEIFPVGLVMSLLAAAFQRHRGRAATA